MGEGAIPGHSIQASAHPSSLFSLCPGWKVAPSRRAGVGAGCQEPGSFAQWQLDVSLGAMRVAGVSQGVLTLYTREDMQQLCLQPTGRQRGWGHSGYSRDLVTLLP